MGRTTSHHPVREVPTGAVRCYLCMSSPAQDVVRGFGEALVNVCTFCYTALQATHLEGRHDETATR
jgi:hypothetical protein